MNESALQPLILALSSWWPSRSLSPLCLYTFIPKSQPGLGAPDVAPWVPSKQLGAATFLGLLTVVHLCDWYTATPSPQERTADSHSTKISNTILWDPLGLINVPTSDKQQKFSGKCFGFWPDPSSLRLQMHQNLFTCPSLFRLHAQNRSCKSSQVSSVQQRARQEEQAYFSFGKPKIFLGVKLLKSAFRVVWRFAEGFFASRDKKLIFSLARVILSITEY